jgi:hypothetical protein
MQQEQQSKQLLVLVVQVELAVTVAQLESELLAEPALSEVRPVRQEFCMPVALLDSTTEPFKDFHILQVM